MPPSFLRKPLRTVCVDTVLFFAMFALVGHITINYWERYTIQNELFTMKHSLHILKDNIGKIGKAYDNLHTQLKSLVIEVDKKLIEDTPECRLKEKLEAKCKAAYNLNQKHRNFQVQTIPKSRQYSQIETDYYKKSYGRQHKATGPRGIHASTNTRYPPKSIGTTTPSDISNDIGYIRKKTCFKDIDDHRNDFDDHRTDFDDHRSRHVCHGTTGRPDKY